MTVRPWYYGIGPSGCGKEQNILCFLPPFFKDVHPRQRSRSQAGPIHGRPIEIAKMIAPSATEELQTFHNSYYHWDTGPATAAAAYGSGSEATARPGETKSVRLITQMMQGMYSQGDSGRCFHKTLWKNTSTSALGWKMKYPGT